MIKFEKTYLLIELDLKNILRKILFEKTLFFHLVLQ